MTRNFVFAMLVFVSCNQNEMPSSAGVRFEGSIPVAVMGYSDHVMEPFLSRDGSQLFFNNSNEADNTNLHWGVRINDSTFQYQGEIDGVNTESLEGVPTMDGNGKFYFVSTREYIVTLGSLFVGDFDNGKVDHISSLENLSLLQNGWINFDVEIDSAGETLYFVDGRFDQFGGPYAADLAIAYKVADEFVRASDSDAILKNINTSNLEYAACISANNLEFYFTRVRVPVNTNTEPEIWVATRQNPHAVFDAPSRIQAITGFSEAATLSPDGGLLYYHKRNQAGVFSLFMTRRVP